MTTLFRQYWRRSVWQNFRVFSSSCAENNSAKVSIKPSPGFRVYNCHACISAWCCLKKYWAVLHSINKRQCSKPYFRTYHGRPESQKNNQHLVVVAKSTRHRMCRHRSSPKDAMRHQRPMPRQTTRRRNASSGGNASSGNVLSQCVVKGAGIIANASSQCVVSVSAKSHTQAAGALLQ